MNHAKTIAYLCFSLTTATLVGCETTAARHEMIVAGQKVTYTLQKCKPSIKWEGINLVIEGMQVPKSGDMMFSIGKIDFSEKAIRDINETVFFYDSLLNATCQTLVRLDKQESIKEYSLHRDALLQSLANTLSKIASAPNSAAAEVSAKEGKAEGSSLGSAPKKN